jgi:tripartite-type tricarboxylate transporter receptor subunit TctC
MGCYLLAVSGLLSFTVTPVIAQPAYPARPVRLVVPFAPGGGTDIIARIIAQKLAEPFGQSVVVDNRGGAGGSIGTEIVAKSPADGYTLLMAPTSHVINPSIYSKLPYDTVKDFAPVTLAASATILLAVHPSMAAKSVKELIALTKAQGSKISYGSAGTGTVFHLTGELFKRQAGIEMTHVPFKGGGPTVTSLLAGQVNVAFETMLALQPHVQGGKLRALAVTSVKRSTVMPDIPTTGEQGFKDIVADNWYGFYAPVGTSKDIVGKLNTEIVKILRAQDVKDRFHSQGTEVLGGTPDQLAKYVASEITKWSKAAKEAGARVE